MRPLLGWNKFPVLCWMALSKTLARDNESPWGKQQTLVGDESAVPQP
jgi:hypothetical protein